MSQDTTALTTDFPGDYETVLADVVGLLETARRQAARSVNAAMTATYWQIGRRIVEQEQCGQARAGYGEQPIKRLATDLTTRFGRGFGQRNLEQMRQFYRTWQIPQTVSAESELAGPDTVFPLPWSHYVKMLSVRKPDARAFYEAEALRGGWSLRQLSRQIGTQFYERTLLSRNKAAMLNKGTKPQPEGILTPEGEIKDPYVLEFLNLKDEYSEQDLEEALIRPAQYRPGRRVPRCPAGRSRADCRTRPHPSPAGISGASAPVTLRQALP